jgi:lipopolysaccharide transport system permease protein
MRYLEEDGTPVTVYLPNERRGGLIWGLKQAYEDVVASRHVILRLFWRDFIAQFRQKILGYSWALLSPLLGIASFLFLFLIGVLRPGEGEIPYMLYVLVGSTIWGCLPVQWARSAEGCRHRQTSLCARASQNSRSPSARWQHLPTASASA